MSNTSNKQKSPKKTSKNPAAKSKIITTRRNWVDWIVVFNKEPSKKDIVEKKRKIKEYLFKRLRKNEYWLKRVDIEWSSEFKNQLLHYFVVNFKENGYLRTSDQKGSVNPPPPPPPPGPL